MNQSQGPGNAPTFDPMMWQQFFQQMTQNAAAMQQAAQRSAGGQTGTFDASEMAKQMHNAMLDGLAKWCDDYLRSPQFLDMMKKSLDTSLAMRREMQEFLQKASGNAFGETIMSQTDPAGSIRATEERLTERMEEICRRLDAIENSVGGGKATNSRPARSSKKTSKKTPKKPAKKTSKKKKTTRRS